MPVFVTENGVGDSGDLIDTTRESYYKVTYQSKWLENPMTTDRLNGWINFLFISVIPATINPCYERGQLQCNRIHSVVAFR